MFVRIVKMSFSEEHIDDFLNHFEFNKNLIKHFNGCKLLELYRDKNQQNVFFTYSYWESEQHLEQYRQSDLFKNVWTGTKPFFNAKPEAWSLDKVDSLE